MAHLDLRTLWLLALGLATCRGPAGEPATRAGSGAPCARLCDHLAVCGPPKKFPGVASCTRVCEDDPRQQGGACQAPRLAYERCVTGLACADVRNLEDVDAAKRGPCGAEIAAVLACEPASEFKPVTFQF